MTLIRKYAESMSARHLFLVLQIALRSLVRCCGGWNRRTVQFQQCESKFKSFECQMTLWPTG